MQTLEYQTYIKSDEWKAKAQERMKLDNFKCAMCGRKQSESRALQVHHIHYKNLGNEDIENDLVTLCGRCHILIHAYYKRYRGKKLSTANSLDT